MIRAILAGLLVAGAACGGTFVDAQSYVTSFERDEWTPIQEGDMAELPNWHVSSGRASIITNGGVHGLQGVLLDSNTVACLSYTGSTDVLWVDIHLRVDETPRASPTNYIPAPPPQLRPLVLR